MDYILLQPYTTRFISNIYSLMTLSIPECTILSEHSAAAQANSTLISSGGRAEDVQVQTSMVNTCRCGSPPADRKEVPHLADRPTSGPAAAASALYSGGQNQGLSPASSASTIYCREKNRKGKTGKTGKSWVCLICSTRGRSSSCSSSSSKQSIVGRGWGV